MQARHVIRVVFGEQMKTDQVSGMLSGLLPYGDVTHDPDGRTFVVDIRREAKCEGLKRELRVWESWGFVRWEQLS